MKTGRNDPCPCGSGKKYKKCHLHSTQAVLSESERLRPIPPEVLQSLRRRELQEEHRRATYGKIKPILEIPNPHDHRLVAVRNHIYYNHKSKWRFFTDFLNEYAKMRLGADWFAAQKAAAKPERHPLYVWMKQAHAYQQKQKPQPDGTFVAVANGPLAICVSFYYDLYTVDDNAILDDTLLNRLRHRDQFQGAMHELFVQATCLRAGFDIVPEDETDGSRRHVEFTAIHRSTGQAICVEAKSRHRPGVMGMSGTPKDLPDIRFLGLIKDALGKEQEKPFALFLDTNLPHADAQLFYQLQSTSPITISRAMLKQVEHVQKEYGGVDPYNVLVYSNHPQHYSSSDDAAPRSMAVGLISRKARIPVQHPDALIALVKSADIYGRVPSHFPEATP